MCIYGSKCINLCFHKSKVKLFKTSGKVFNTVQGQPSLCVGEEGPVYKGVQKHRYIALQWCDFKNFCFFIANVQVWTSSHYACKKEKKIMWDGLLKYLPQHQHLSIFSI